MGKIDQISVAFQGPREYYRPGDVVSGVVTFVLSKPVKVTVVKVQIGGWGKTKWKTGSGDDEKTYKGTEQYCLLQTIFWGIENAQQPTTISNGSYQKSFSLQLPTNCPSTFSSKHGNIWYTASVICTFPGMLSLDQTSDHAFTVVDNVDLSSGPQTAELMLRPLQIKQETVEDDCCCCGKYHANIDITLDKSAYTPGDYITLNGFIENGCQEPMPYYIVMKQYVVCYGKRSDFSLTSSGNLKKKEKTFEIARYDGRSIASRSREVLTNVRTIKVPTAVSTGLRNCNIIDVNYFVKVKGTFHGFCNTPFETKAMELVVGGRPQGEQLTTTVPTAPSNEPPDYLSLPPPIPSAPLSENTKPAENDLLPPTYAESALMNSTAPAETTYYDWSQSAFTYN